MTLITLCVGCTFTPTEKEKRKERENKLKIQPLVCSVNMDQRLSASPDLVVE
jgi:hypothetical protein